jgi:hypothetical protein
MLLRVGGLLVTTGLTFALVLGSGFAAIGGVLMICGGIVLALALEPLLAERIPQPGTWGELIEPDDKTVA